MPYHDDLCRPRVRSGAVKQEVVHTAMLAHMSAHLLFLGRFALRCGLPNCLWSQQPCSFLPSLFLYPRCPPPVVSLPSRHPLVLPYIQQGIQDLRLCVADAQKACIYIFVCVCVADRMEAGLTGLSCYPHGDRTRSPPNTQLASPRTRKERSLALLLHRTRSCAALRSHRACCFRWVHQYFSLSRPLSQRPLALFYAEALLERTSMMPTSSSLSSCMPLAASRRRGRRHVLPHHVTPCFFPMPLQLAPVDTEAFGASASVARASRLSFEMATRRRHPGNKTGSRLAS